MNTKSAAVQQQELVAHLRQQVPGLIAVYRYGSWTTPHERGDSDADIAFLAAERVPNLRRWEIAEQLAAIIGRDVDLADLRTASTVLAAQIVSRGERIFCSDAPRCGEFEDYSYSAYARLNEERRGILEDIRATGSVYGR